MKGGDYMVNQKIREKSNNTFLLDFSLSDSQINRLCKDIFTIKRRFGIKNTHKLYPYADKDTLRKYDYY